MSRMFIDENAIRDKEWKDKVLDDFAEKFNVDKLTPTEWRDWLVKTMDEYVEFFNAEPEEEKVDKMPCAICKKEFEWKDVIRVRGLGMWCQSCLDKDEEQAGGTSVGGMI